MKNLYLGIDIGTSTMKLVLIDENKHVVAKRTESYEAASLEQGFCEINPDIWFACLKAGVHKIMENIEGGMVKSIGVTGQMHTLVVIGRDGLPVRPAIMWNDTRTKELIPELKESISHFPEGEYLARTISTGSPAANLYWLSQCEKESFQKIHKFMIGPDYLVYCLTGHCGTDYCEASTSCLYEIGNRRWSVKMRDLIGLKDEMYPEIRGSAISAGTLKKELAEEFGLSETVEVLTGTGDNPATSISTGCLGEGYPVISLGTSGVFMMPVTSLQEERKGKMILFSFDGKEIFHVVQGVVQSNGSTMEWWFKRIMEKDDFSEIDDTIQVSDRVGNELLFYPHLMGDKTIYANPDIRGAFLGLSAETDREDMMFAVIEGLCLAFRELAEQMQFDFSEHDSIKVLGGGSRSKVWMQTLANVFHKKIEQLDGMMGPAFGIALLAAYGSREMDAFSHMAEDTIKVRQCFFPQEAYKELYQNKYQRYLRVHKGMQYIYGKQEL